MRNKAEGSDMSTGNVTKLEKGVFTQAFVFLYLLMFTSAETQLRCSVTRSRLIGDRFVFRYYSGTCTKGLNPCKRVNAVYKYSGINCSCQCSRLKSTYREDLGFCVENEEIREECTLLFSKEKDTQSLRVFNRSSSIKLNTIPREDCFVTGTAYVIANNGTAAWKQFQAAKLPFLIHHEDRKKDKHDHFLRWNGRPVTEIFGKIVKVDVQCQKPRGRGSDTLSKMCIVFKVKGSVNLPCPVATPSTTVMVTTGSKRTQLPESNHTTRKPPVTFTDIATVLLEPNATTDPSIMDSGEKEFHDADKNALPIWLIAVVAGGAVIATLCITAIIWICCRMKRRSNKKRNKSTTRRRLVVDNSLYQGDDFVAVAPWDGGTKTSEPGYAKVGSPSGQSKGYTCLKPSPERYRSEYQKLLKKPTEDHSGYLVPMEEVTTNTRCPLEPAIYSEAQSPKPEPPPHKPKSKEYDYAKPEDVIVLTASRSSLDNLDSYKGTNLEPNEEGYVEVRDSESNVPSSPLYAVVEGPNSPKSPGVPSEGDLLENELDDPPGDYIEVLPDTENENRDSET